MRLIQGMTQPAQNERGGAIGWVLLLAAFGTAVILVSVMVPPWVQNFRVQEVVKDMAVRARKIDNEESLWKQLDKKVRGLKLEGMELEGEYNGQPNGVFVDPDRSARVITIGVAYDRVRMWPGINKEYRTHYEVFETVPWK